MSELSIREMENGEEFAEWFSDLTLREEQERGEGLYLEDHFLVLSNEIGDWIGGLRYHIRGGVAHLADIAISPEERHHGHAHRLVEAFEQRARSNGAHLIEFWTDDPTHEGELILNGWQRVMRREGYFGGKTWYLMEKALVPED